MNTADTVEQSRCDFYAMVFCCEIWITQTIPGTSIEPHGKELLKGVPDPRLKDSASQTNRKLRQ